MVLKSSLKQLLNPFRLREGVAVEVVKSKIADLYGIDKGCVMPLYNGRSVEDLFFKSIDLGQGDEVLIQAFTCNAVPNPVLWHGAKAVFVDMDPQTYTFDLADLGRKINEKTRVIIVQHTFGVAVNINEIRRLIGDRKIYIFEDCAHALGVGYKGRKLGLEGDVALVSFGLEKTLPTQFGAVMLINNPALHEKLMKSFAELRHASFSRIAKSLLDPLIWSIYIKIPNLRGIIKTLNLLNVGSDKKEWRGERPSYIPAKFPNSLANVLLGEIDAIERINEHRKVLSDLYFNELKAYSEIISLPVNSFGVEGIPYLKYPVLVATPEIKDFVLNEFLKKGVILSKWYSSVISPSNVEPSVFGYTKGDAPKAEDSASRVLNLPTEPYVTEEAAKKLVAELLEIIERFSAS